MWSEEDKDALCAVGRSGLVGWPLVESISTRAVELVAARGSDDIPLRDALSALALASNDHKVRAAAVALEDQILARDAAMGARVAVLERDLDLNRKGFDSGSIAEVSIRALEAERATLKAELASLKPSGQLAEASRALRVRMAEACQMRCSNTPLHEAACDAARDALSRLAAGAQRADATERLADARALNVTQLATAYQSLEQQVDAIRKRSLEAKHLEAMLSEKGLPAMLRYVVDGPQEDDCPHNARGGFCATCDGGDVGAAMVDEAQCQACGEEPVAASELLNPPALGAKCAAEVTSQSLKCGSCRVVRDHQWHQGWRCSICGEVSTAERYPCSDTCTHDDAATPGHPERVKGRSEAFIRTLTPEEEAAGDDAYATAQEEGAEAMRAACWEAVQATYDRHGWVKGGPMYEALKAAIESATT